MLEVYHPTDASSLCTGYGSLETDTHFWSKFIALEESDPVESNTDCLQSWDK